MRMLDLLEQRSALAAELERLAAGWEIDADRFEELQAQTADVGEALKAAAQGRATGIIVCPSIGSLLRKEEDARARRSALEVLRRWAITGRLPAGQRKYERRADVHGTGGYLVGEHLYGALFERIERASPLISAIRRLTPVTGLGVQGVVPLPAAADLGGLASRTEAHAADAFAQCGAAARTPSHCSAAAVLSGQLLRTAKIGAADVMLDIFAHRMAAALEHRIIAAIAAAVPDTAAGRSVAVDSSGAITHADLAEVFLRLPAYEHRIAAWVIGPAMGDAIAAAAADDARPAAAPGNARGRNPLDRLMGRRVIESRGIAGGLDTNSGAGYFGNLRQIVYLPGGMPRIVRDASALAREGQVRFSLNTCDAVVCTDSRQFVRINGA